MLLLDNGSACLGQFVHPIKLHAPAPSAPYVGLKDLGPQASARIGAARRIVLAVLPESAMASLCFATRKRNEAWNPGSFGCRGLFV
jgi:hypothetical protein